MDLTLNFLEKWKNPVKTKKNPKTTSNTKPLEKHRKKIPNQPHQEKEATEPCNRELRWVRTWATLSLASSLIMRLCPHAHLLAFSYFHEEIQTAYCCIFLCENNYIKIINIWAKEILAFQLTVTLYLFFPLSEVKKADILNSGLCWQ